MTCSNTTNITETEIHHLSGFSAIACSSDILPLTTKLLK